MTTDNKPIIKMTTEEKNKWLHEILGLHWHDVSDKYCCSCVKDKVPMSLEALDAHYRLNTNFYADAGTIPLLRELEKQEWYNTFIYGEFYYKSDTPNNLLNTLTTPGLLADKVIEWRNNGNNN